MTFKTTNIGLGESQNSKENNLCVLVIKILKKFLHKIPQERILLNEFFHNSFSSMVAFLERVKNIFQTNPISFGKDELETLVKNKRRESLMHLRGLRLRSRF